MRESGTKAAAILFPVGDQMTTLLIDAYPAEKYVTNLSEVKGVKANKNPESFKGFILQQRVKFPVVINVKKIKAGFEISVTINGNKIVEWQGDNHDLKPDWDAPYKSGLIGVGANDNDFIFSSISVKQSKE